MHKTLQENWEIVTGEQTVPAELATIADEFIREKARLTSEPVTPGEYATLFIVYRLRRADKKKKEPAA